MTMLDQYPPPEDRKAGWKDDPFAPGMKRRWDGAAWTDRIVKDPKAGKKPMPSSLKIAIGIGVALVVIIAIAGSSGSDDGGEKSSSDPDPVAAAVPESFDKKLQDAVLESVDEKGTPTFWCKGSECKVFYTRGAALGVLLSPQEEILGEQRRIWETMFARKQTKTAGIYVKGPVQTVGGKSRIEPILTTVCDRSAANEIDWNLVDVEGMEVLCDQTEWVNFD